MTESQPNYTSIASLMTTLRGEVTAGRMTADQAERKIRRQLLLTSPMVTAATVAHVTDKPDPDDLYIGRGAYGREGSLFGNPFVLRKTGIAAVDRSERWSVIHRYAQHLATSPNLVTELESLRDRRLLCWCRHAGEPMTPDTICHGDVLARAIPLGSSFSLSAVASIMFDIKKFAYGDMTDGES